MDVLTLAGQVPSPDGEWLLVTSLDAEPAAEFLAVHLPLDELCARGGDVLVRVVPQGDPGLPEAGVQVWAVLGGQLILAGAWDRQDLGGWAEQVRPAVAFAMGMLTELGECGAELGARRRVRLDDPQAAAVGVPPGITSRPAAGSWPG